MTTRHSHDGKMEIEDELTLPGQSSIEDDTERGLVAKYSEPLLYPKRRSVGGSSIGSGTVPPRRMTSYSFRSAANNVRQRNRVKEALLNNPKKLKKNFQSTETLGASRKYNFKDDSVQGAFEKKQKILSVEKSRAKRRRAKAKGWGSSDIERIPTRVSMNESTPFLTYIRPDKPKPRSSWKSAFTNLSFTSNLFLLLLGICSGTLAWCQNQVILQLRAGRDLAIDKLDGYYWAQYCVFVSFSMISLLFAVLVVRYVSPAAAGSGIPEMKCILSGTELTNFFSFKTLVAKILGLTFSVASGISIGREGPFVHTTAIIAKNFFHLKIFKRVAKNRLLCHQILSAACAVGVASTFGAPVGGVIFSIEVTCDYYMLSSFWRSCLCSIAGALVVHFFNPTSYINIDRSLSAEYSFKNLEFVLFGVMAVIGGVIGGGFVLLHEKIVRLKRSFGNNFLIGVIFPVFIAALTAIIIFPFGVWLKQPLAKSISDMFHNSHLDVFDKGWTGGWGIYANLSIFLLVHFCLTIFSITLPIPCGTFLPVLAMGSALGRMVGELGLQYVGEFISPGAYSIIGAVVMGGSVTRTISTAVIILELTGDIACLTPCLFVVLISIAVGNKFSRSIYNSMLFVKGLPYLPKISSIDSSRSKTARDVMNSNLKYFVRQSSFKDFYNILSDPEAKFASYPVVDDDTSMYLMGAVSRSSLEMILHEEFEEEIDAICAKMPIDDNTIDLIHVLGQIENEEKWNTRIDLISHQLTVLDPSPFQLVAECPLSEAHFIFTMLRCTHVFVCAYGRLEGVIVMRDLMLLE